MAYYPQSIEKKWQARWQAEKQFAARDFSDKEKFYALVEFPYPSGEGLHVGHAFTFTLMDIFARHKRMSGFNILYPMGWDAFGLPAENYALKTGVQPAVTTQKSIARFKEQMKQLAFSFDWQREIATTDPNYYRWTQWIFIQLFKHGLAFKEIMAINWCPACKIGLANEEVVDNKCERCGAKVGRQELSQWLLRITQYADRLTDELGLVDFPAAVKAAQRHWIGRSEGMLIKFAIEGKKETIPVFTTRPDTLFGATFFVLAPEHPIVASILNSEFEIPASKLKEIREYVDASKAKMELERLAETKEKTGVFTGLYVINPLNKKKIPVYVADFVIMSYGSGAVMGVPAHDERDWQFARKNGLEIIEVISGGNVSQKPYLGEGLLVNSGKYNGLDCQQAKEKIFTELKQKGMAEKSTQYHLRDWIFSRQHYWGEPIPMIYCPACGKKGISWWQTAEGKKTKPLFSPVGDLAGWFPVAEEALPLRLPEVEKYEPTGTGESPLAAIKDWVETRCPECGGPARRETDTMPNWAGSSWYFLRFCDPGNSRALADREKMNYWLPADVYLGGAEHTTLHLLYSRFWHKFLNDLDLVPFKEPYKARRQHGVILGEDGQRMSKSKGNTVDPGEMSEKFGVDALRLYFAFIGPFDGVFPWRIAGLRGTRKFLERIYGFVIKRGQAREKSDPEIKNLINRLIFAVGKDIEEFKANTAVAKMMKFLNQAEKQKIAVEDLKKLAIILAPFAPYLSEELWERLGGRSSVHKQAWPKYNPDSIKAEEIILIVQVNGKVREKIKTAAAITKEQARALALASKKVEKWLAGKEIKEIIFVPAKLINIVI